MNNTQTKTDILFEKIFNIFHIIFLFSPILIYAIPPVYLKPYMKWFLLIVILTPIHWKFFDNRCILTILSKKLFNSYQNTETDSEFSETNLKWLYKPIMNIIGWEWNDMGLDKMVYLHWTINILLVWFYTFYYAL